MKKVVITGCCVSRDLFNYDRMKNYEVQKFIQFNPISLQNAKGAGIDILSDFHKIIWKSNFIKRCAECALENSLIPSVLAPEGEILVLDLAEERIPKAIIDFQGKQVVVAKHAFYESIFGLMGKGDYRDAHIKDIRFNAMPWDDVVSNYKNFTCKMLSKYKEENIVIIEIFMSGRFIDKDYSIVCYNEKNSGFSQKYIADVNSYLEKCYQLLYTLLPKAKKIRIPKEILTTYYHRWGINPLHFTAETYEYLIKCMDILTGISYEDSCESLYEELKMKNEMYFRVFGNGRGI